MNDYLEIDLKEELFTMLDDNTLNEEYTLPLSNQKTKSFKRFYLESLLQESPMRSGVWQNPPYEDWAYNQMEALNLIEGKVGELVDTFEHINKVRIYKTIKNDKWTGTIITFFLIPEKMNAIMGSVKIINGLKLVGKNYHFTNGIWNSSFGGKGLIYNFFIKWLLPHYKLIISDISTSPLGELFWKKIIQYGLNNNKECGIYIMPEPNLKREELFKQMHNIGEVETAWSEQGFIKRLYIKE